MVKIFRISKGSSLSRIKDYEFSPSPSLKILDLNFLRFFILANLQQYFRVQKLFLIGPLRENNAVANNTHRNCIQNGFIAKTGSTKVYSLPYGIIAKWSRKNTSCTELSREWSRLFIYKGIFDFAIIPYLLVATAS